MGGLADTLKKQSFRKSVSSDTDKLDVFYTLDLEIEGFKYSVDIKSLIKANLQSLSTLELMELAVQGEKISSIRSAIAASIKFLSGVVTSKEIEYRIWKAKANDFGYTEYYALVRAAKEDPAIKSLLKAPTKEDVQDRYLQDDSYKNEYRDFEFVIDELKQRLKFLGHIDDILNSRSIMIQSLLKREERVRVLSDRTSNG